VPLQPVQQSNGSIRAGNLVILPGSGTTVALVNMPTVDADFLGGWRIDITNATGCSYDVLLAVQPTATLPEHLYVPMVVR
jgi:hypothetical protein